MHLRIVDSENLPSFKERRISAESQKIGGEFAEFLKSMRKKPAALEISKQVTFFVWNVMFDCNEGSLHVELYLN